MIMQLQHAMTIFWLEFLKIEYIEFEHWSLSGGIFSNEFLRISPHNTY